FLFAVRRPPRPPLFPYTTLFRSQPRVGVRRLEEPRAAVVEQVALVDGLDPERVPALGERGEHGRAFGLGLARCTPERTLALGLRSEEHTSELQSQSNLVCRLLLE